MDGNALSEGNPGEGRVKSLRFHRYVFDNYEKIGYENTHELLRKHLSQDRDKLPEEEIRELERRIQKNQLFEGYKSVLLQIVATADWSNTMISWIVDIRRRERSKQEIADILSEFAVFVQYYPGTKDNEVLYDSLCDILDGFSDYGPPRKILPDEPNVTFS